MKKILSLIRWRFVVPTLIVVAIASIFLIFLLDPILTIVIEKAGAKVNGARVDVSGLKTKIFKGRLQITRIQVADKDRPMKNKVDLGPLAFQIDLSELVGKRLIIPEASVEGIRLDTDRKISGAIKTVAEPKKSASSTEPPGTMSLLADKYKGRFKFTFEGLKSGAHQKIDVDPKDLELTKRSEALKAKAGALPDDWKKKVSQLNVDERLKKAEADLKDLKGIQVRNLQDLGKAAEQAKKLKEVQASLQQLKSDLATTKSSLSGEISNFKAGISGLEAAKKKDMDNLMSRFNLDFADPQKLAEGIVGPLAFERIQTTIHTIKLIREKMPSKKKQKEPPPPPRGKGIDVQFPTPAALPRFWLAHSTLSGELKGVTAKGKLANFTSDPARIGKPATINFNGSKGESLYHLNGLFDHVTDVSHDQLDLMASDLPAEAVMTTGLLADALSSGLADITLFFSAQGEHDIGGVLQIDLKKIKLNRDVLKSQAGLSSSAPESTEDKIKDKFITNLVKGIEAMPSVQIKAALTGTWENPDFKLSTNLAGTCAAVLKNSVGDLVGDQKKELEGKLNAILTSQQTDLNGRLAGLTGTMNGQLGGYDEKIQQTISDATGLSTGGSKGPAPKINIPSLDKLFH